MLAMSLALIWGRAGLLCFGQAMFFGIGAYAMAISTKGMAGEALASTYVGLLLAIGAAGLFAAVLGYFLFCGARPVRPLSRDRHAGDRPDPRAPAQQLVCARRLQRPARCAAA